jgi:2',3'-cyclic-nucleotide 2'-phosphodiesterase
VRILFVGDIVGRPGRAVLRRLLPELRARFGPEAIVANAENAAGGFGLTRKVADELFGLGVSVLTSGNHIWDKKEVLEVMDGDGRVLRPANYPPGTPGRGACRFGLPDGRALWVINLQGRVLMPPVDCPFRTADALFSGIPEGERCVLVDMHAEATSEKRGMGFHLDGRASVVVGTHTHVPTADAEILPKGTGYLTDAGMTGPYASVIGMQVEDSMQRLLLGIPRVLNVAKGGEAFGGLYAELDDASGRCLTLQPLFIKPDPAPPESR